MKPTVLVSVAQRELLCDATIDSLQTGPQARGHAHHVGDSCGVEGAILEVVRPKALGRGTDSVHFSGGRRVAGVQCGIRPGGDDFSVAHDDGAEGLALLRGSLLGGSACYVDRPTHERLVTGVRLLLHGDCRHLLGLLHAADRCPGRRPAPEGILVYLAEHATAGIEAPQSVSVGAPLEQCLCLRPGDPRVDLDHVLVHPLLAQLALQSPGGTLDVAIVEEAVAVQPEGGGVVFHLVVKHLVVEAVLRRGEAVGSDVDLVQTAPLHGTPTHRARLARGVKLAIRQVVALERGAGLPHRIHFGVAGGIPVEQH
mmetsp:Transcript_92768/g.261954  ORF Transcript_92768/g.261954 Transcript_92768/m.261954 type:complete len:312 (+) Transcript_92768:313-1248(+)